MAQFAVINAGFVVNAIEADSKEIAEEVTGLLCVDLGLGSIGNGYNEETGELFELIAAEDPNADESSESEPPTE